MTLLFVCAFSNFSKAQEKGKLLLVWGGDIYKTGRPEGVFKRFQLGFEGNYFVTNALALGLGGEIYTQKGNTVSYLAPSVRLYPIGGLFLRTRPMLPLNNQGFELDLGAGYDFKFSDTWALEFVGDYYPVKQNALALRLGIAGFF